ncbi:glucose PTS transporter subunit IIA [Paenibacillus sp. NPDC056933]|uniref:PTS beta-glucoside transporter subunit IIBCA n=1 Tax=Paenibacillus sp. NPDC056933 TaxID=3345968 RepID=UPI0036311B44
MKDHELAKRILELVGGKDNIHSVEHCATRLRIMIADKDKINDEEMGNLQGVKGSFFNSGQYQIILGTGLVNKIYAEMMKLMDGTVPTEAPVKKEGNRFQRAVRIFGDIFVPIIPVLVATGLFMGLRSLLTQAAVLGLIGLTPENVPEELLLFTQILTDTAFAFLPALICWSTFRVFGGSPVLGIVLGLMLVNPALPNAYAVGQNLAEPLVFFDFIKVLGYQGSVLPAFIIGIVGSKIEKFLRTKIPNSLDLILTPFLTLLISIVLALFMIGPIFHEIEIFVLHGVEFLLRLPFGLGGLLYGSFSQLLGIFGIHHIISFLEINMLTQTGWNMLNPISPGNVAAAGAVLAVAIKTRSQKLKQIAYPSSFSAALGITEPAVFGVTLPLVKPFIMSMIGGGVGGFLASILQLKATGMSLTGIPGILLYLNNQLPLYILVNAVAFAVSFSLTYTIGYRNSGDDTDPVAKGKKKSNIEVIEIASPIKGHAVSLESVPDEAFSSKAMGDGIAIMPSEGKVTAPFTGKVMHIMEKSKHAVIVEHASGVQLLIHVGIDTVSLKGNGFQSYVQSGDMVQVGQLILEFDIPAIQDAGYPVISPIIIPDGQENIQKVESLVSNESRIDGPILRISVQSN